MKPIRPVWCWFCNRQMYYISDGRHVPEVQVIVYPNGPSFDFYAHATCWEAMARRRKAKLKPDWCTKLDKLDRDITRKAKAKGRR